jgi:uncharacterized protein (DUF2267 family)
VKYHEFMERVQQRTGLDEEQAEKAVRATLNTLAQRLSGGEPKDVASQLPGELKEAMLLTAGRGMGESMSLKQFLETVANREGCPADAAEEHVRAVMATLHEAVTDGEWDDLVSQLGHEYRPLVEA